MSLYDIFTRGFGKAKDARIADLEAEQWTCSATVMSKMPALLS